MPKIEEIILQLEKFKKSHIAEVKPLIGKLQNLIKSRPQSSPAEEKANTSFEDKVIRLINDLNKDRSKIKNSKEYSKKLDELLYQTILAVAAEKPLDIIDFNRETIPSEYMIVVSTRHAFDIRDIVLFIRTQNPPRNPYTTLAFSAEDLNTIQQFAKKFPDLVDLVSNESKNSAPQNQENIIQMMPIQAALGPIQPAMPEDGNEMEDDAAPNIESDWQKKINNELKIIGYFLARTTVPTAFLSTFFPIDKESELYPSYAILALAALQYKFCAITSISDLPEVKLVKSSLDRLSNAVKAIPNNTIDVITKTARYSAIGLLTAFYVGLGNDSEIPSKLFGSIFLLTLGELYFNKFNNTSLLPEIKPLRNFVNRFFRGENLQNPLAQQPDPAPALGME